MSRFKSFENVQIGQIDRAGRTDQSEKNLDSYSILLQIHSGTFNISNPMKILRKKAFTLVELLVVIAIIGILAAFAVPAMGGAIRSAQMANVLSNARQFYIATFAINLDMETAGLGTAWPSTASTNSTFDGYISQLGFKRGDLQRLLAAPGITVSITDGDQLTTQSRPNRAMRFYAVGDVPDDGMQVFISTYNVTCGPGSIEIDTAAQPFGDFGGVLFRRGGSGESMKASILTAEAVRAIVPTNQAMPIWD